MERTPWLLVTGSLTGAKPGSWGLVPPYGEQGLGGPGWAWVAVPTGDPSLSSPDHSQTPVDTEPRVSGGRHPEARGCPSQVSVVGPCEVGVIPNGCF